MCVVYVQRDTDKNLAIKYIIKTHKYPLDRDERSTKRFDWEFWGWVRESVCVNKRIAYRDGRGMDGEGVVAGFVCHTDVTWGRLGAAHTRSLSL